MALGAWQARGGRGSRKSKWRAKMGENQSLEKCEKSSSNVVLCGGD